MCAVVAAALVTFLSPLCGGQINAPEAKRSAAGAAGRARGKTARCCCIMHVEKEKSNLLQSDTPLSPEQPVSFLHLVSQCGVRESCVFLSRGPGISIKIP